MRERVSGSIRRWPASWGAFGGLVGLVGLLALRGARHDFLWEYVDFGGEFDGWGAVLLFCFVAVVMGYWWALGLRFWRLFGLEVPGGIAAGSGVAVFNILLLPLFIYIAID